MVLPLCSHPHSWWKEQNCLIRMAVSETGDEEAQRILQPYFDHSETCSLCQEAERQNERYLRELLGVPKVEFPKLDP